MEASVKNAIVGTLLVVLFSIALINFGIDFGIQENAPFNIGNDSRIETLNEQLTSNVEDDYDDSGSGINETAGGTTESIGEEDTSGNLVSDFVMAGIMGIGKTLMGEVHVFAGILISPLLNIVFSGAPEIARVVSYILTSILMFMMVLLVWKLIKTGR